MLYQVLVEKLPDAVLDNLMMPSSVFEATCCVHGKEGAWLLQRKLWQKSNTGVDSGTNAAIPAVQLQQLLRCGLPVC